MSLKFSGTILSCIEWPAGKNNTVKTKKPHKSEVFNKWCLDAESNHGHEDFQSSALPTELSRHINCAS